MIRPTGSGSYQLIAADSASFWASSMAYVTNYSERTVSVIDTVTRKVIATIAVGNQPAEIALAPTGRTAYVTEVKMLRLVQFRVDRPGLEWQRWGR